ncbi:hypothetical protein ACRE_016940 [Hapsidospora chrysogenum ATCC 11550]|uniref:Uncharacterized protein n=1 Tax=Hapsidospora chrysogenum (strain ATCC 11550 / CBS 779.69 / DSM 880 / IAM 14645 / JCM 23072 / IMI 49137) TaxID=857340 RepID=A0A086TDL1_HAPC1|nr:hypothetical protein ACRE_016940 [Hapsidospora chrysogenum ATCC 11550]
MDTAVLDTQHHMETLPDLHRKRGRDDEQDLSLGPSSFGEHRNKRLHGLPVRTAPRDNQQQWPSSPDDITPLNASPGVLRRSHMESSSYLPAEPRLAPQQDTEMDMMDATGEASASPHNTSLLVPEVDPVTGTNRMPTPIQPSFAAQVRGQQHEWAGNGLQNSPANEQAVPRTLATGEDWHAVQNNRRLPSPISECCDDSATTSLHQSSSHGMQHPNAMMDVEPRSSSQPPETDAGDSPGPSPERRGHMRSKHTINTWTWQPGMKKSFSIGYRADCEKCRLKVPGHFNHIVIS